MITIYRKYRTDVQRNAAYFSLFLLLFNIGWNAFFNLVLFDFAGQPIYQPVFGKFFVMAHGWLFLGILLSIGMGITFAKLGYIMYPGQVLARTEVDEYNQKYGAQFPLPKNKFLPAFGIIFSTFIGPVIYFTLLFALLPDHFNQSLLTFLHIGFFILMIIIFYSTVVKQRRAGNAKMTDVFRHAAKKIPDTKLELKNDHFGHSLSRLQINMGFEIEGQLRGNEFLISNSTKSTRHWVSSSVEMKGGILIKLPKALPYAFTVSEHKKLLNKFEGASLDEVFKQRFEVRGVEVAQLPDRFKEKLLHSPRSVFFQFSEKGVSHELANLYLPPFFTGQGVVLFLDFMLELVNDLREK